MKVIHIIEGYKSKIKLSLWKSKQPNVETVSVNKGVKYPEVQVAKYGHSFPERKMTQAGIQYAGIKFSIAPDILWEDVWNNLQGRWGIKRKTNMKP